MKITQARLCRKCNQQKPLSAFNKDTLRSPDGYRNDCSDCRRSATFEQRRRKKWLLRYGITPEVYDQLFDEQGGVCAICKQPETGKSNTGETRLLAVDHCHETGRVRGLLCGRCNIVVGMFESFERTDWTDIRRYLAREP